MGSECGTDGLPSRSSGLRIIIADTDHLRRQALQAVLEEDGHQIVGDAADGPVALRKIQALIPDVALLDLYLPFLNGMEVAIEIARACKDTKAILLATNPDPISIIKSIESGVSGYFSKRCDLEDLLQMLRAGSPPMFYLGPNAARTLYRAKPSMSADAPLSEREQDILRRIAEGQSTKFIAANLGISVKTAEAHRVRIKRKLRVEDSAGLVRYALSSGLIPPINDVA
jgi:two-component system nitrate/nitrite response regulator NarL